MKLNLLPTTVSKGKQAKSAFVFSAIIGLAGIGGALYFAQKSAKDLQSARDDNAASVGPAQDAYNRSLVPDTIMANNSVLIRDAQLAKAMEAHNTVYPDLYDKIKKYIPAFFRVNSMSAASAGGTAQVTLVGTIKTYQQYADLMVCFSRMTDPLVVSVGRAGYQFDDDIVPNITPTDQVGRPHKPNEGPVPDDKLERLAYFQGQAQPQGYTGVGNFGTGTDNTRGAMPDYSLVTVTLTVLSNLQVPQPRATLSASGAGAPAAGVGGGGLPTGMPTGMPGAAGKGGPLGGSPPPPPQGGGGRAGSGAGAGNGDSGGKAAGGRKGGNKAYNDALNGSGGD